MHALLETQIRRPLSVEWNDFDAQSTSSNAASRRARDEVGKLRNLFSVLDAQATSRGEKQRGATIQIGLAMIQLAESTCRGVDFSAYLSAENFLQEGLKQIYVALPALDEPQCERCIQRIRAVSRRKPPISQLLNYEAAYWENGFGWSGHLQRIMGNVANQIDPSLDANYTEFLRRVDQRDRVTGNFSSLNFPCECSP